jgi:hypothetical protein
MRSWSELAVQAYVGALACFALAAPSVGLAQGNQETVTAEQLREELAKRDAIIIQLLNRIEALEKERDSASSAEGSARVDTRSRGADPGEAVENTPEDDFDVEGLQAERALERALVDRGVRLLGPGQVELSPRLSMYHDEGKFPTALTDDGTLVGEVERTLDAYARRVDARFGLPFGMQLEIGLPYLSASQQLATSIDGTIQSASEQSGSGDGDATVSLAKAFGVDSSGGARFIGQLTWLAGNGDERDGAVFLGGGSSGVNAKATTYWRRDPVVFIASAGYTRFSEEDSLQIGDSLAVSLGLGLAISPEAALLFSFNQTRTSEFKRAGMVLPGTERLSSFLGLSAQTLLGQRFSLGVDADVGLTDDSPDYVFGVSFSSRFNLR